MFNFQISKIKENRFWFWNEPETLPWLLVGANSSVQSYKKGKWSKDDIFAVFLKSLWLFVLMFESNRR